MLEVRCSVDFVLVGRKKVGDLPPLKFLTIVTRINRNLIVVRSKRYHFFVPYVESLYVLSFFDVQSIVLDSSSIGMKRF